MNDQDKIISFIKVTGPVLPAQVAKHIESNILLASAQLSELSSQGKIKVSSLKIGGSPLYYLLEHKNKLQNFLHNLNPKDQQTLNSLKEKKILQEKYLDLLTRVSLRKIRDFAIPLNITLNNTEELFWKWFLLTDTEAMELIKSQLASPKPESKEPEKAQMPPPSESVPSESFKPEPETKTQLPNKSENNLETPTESQRDSLTPETSVEEKPKKPLLQKIKEKLKPKPSGESEKPQRRKEVLDKFFPQIESFFQEKNIEIEKKENLRKNSEMDFIIKAPSVLGKITYFCKAKNKKRCNEKDLSAAYLVAQSKKLPLLFLYTNEMSKKAQEMLDSNTFENLVVKKLN